ncbi:hypothetical protein OIU14_15370 [Thalassobacter stenotrophicus]|uniref:hypothetical protein n=1 Tax=Thalassobacter stenotrophicus TaxID=266809 RepID=UPI0022A91CE3|nr:hypothetical protein [Thalassobacter stenotrophicus]UYP67828.1 hypothetical protein OIU14_15370 [Thalassobacter stenotrophicus]
MHPDNLLRSDEIILWRGKPSPEWNSPTKMVHKFFNGSINAVYLVPASIAAILALGNLNATSGVVLLVILAFLYHRWQKKAPSQQKTFPITYILTDKQVIYPDFYKVTLGYKAMPNKSVKHIKIKEDGDFIDIIFQEKYVETKGEKPAPFKYTYGFKGVKKDDASFETLKSALKSFEAAGTKITYN